MDADGPVARELKRQIDEMASRLREIEEVLEGSRRWDRTGLVAEARKLGEDQKKIFRLIERIQREAQEAEEARQEREETLATERQRRDDRNSRFQQIVVGGVITLVFGLVGQFIFFYATGGP